MSSRISSFGCFTESCRTVHVGWGLPLWLLAGGRGGEGWPYLGSVELLELVVLQDFGVDRASQSGPEVGSGRARWGAARALSGRSAGSLAASFGHVAGGELNQNQNPDAD